MSDRRYTYGLTLIEIIIVLALVAIIVSIAIPTYENLVIDQRRKDAQISLFETQEAIELIRLEHGSLVSSEIAELPQTSNLGFYAIKISIDKDTYNLNAEPVGPQASDIACGNFTLDNLGQKGISGEANVTDCWD